LKQSGSKRLSVWIERRSGWTSRAEDARGPGDIDYARIIHSASFRRLQGKTQILNLGDSDFYRTRLTHSLEVAQVASGITRQLAQDNPDHHAVTVLPDLPMIQAIGCTHDLGHPPFGHGGEVALNYCMREDGGFEGNGQTLRILARLEKFSEQHGSDLARRTMLGTLKYPTAYSSVSGDKLPRLVAGPSTVRLIDRKVSKPPKCYLDSEADVVDWILAPLNTAERELFTQFSRERDGEHGSPKHKSLDCTIMDVADDVSFGVHDFEDALALGLIDDRDIEQHVSYEAAGPYLTYLKGRYPSEYANDVYSQWVRELFKDSKSRKHAISRLVGYLIKACLFTEEDGFVEPLVRYRVTMEKEAASFLKALKKLVYNTVILSPEVQHLEFKGQQLVVAVFEALASEPIPLLPKDTQQLYEVSPHPRRVICDHVAGMTDSFLLKTYERLYSPRIGSVFDRL
jgi:dGTPase